MKLKNAVTYRAILMIALGTLFIGVIQAFPDNIANRPLDPSAEDCFVYGTVTYKDGSVCANCCSVRAELTGGAFGTMSKEVCTNSDGEYRIDLAYCEVKTMFFKGRTVWEGRANAKGGVRINLKAN